LDHIEVKFANSQIASVLLAGMKATKRKQLKPSLFIC